MPYLCPPTLTADEQRLILRATAKHPRDHVIFSMALGTGLRLSELLGLNVGDVFCARRNPEDPRPCPPRDRQARPGRGRVSARQAGAEAAAVLAVQEAARRGARARRSAVLRAVEATALTEAGPVRLAGVAAAGWVRSALSLPLLAPHIGDCRLPGHPRPVPGAEVREACQSAHHHHLHPPLRRRDGAAGAGAGGLP